MPTVQLFWPGLPSNIAPRNQRNMAVIGQKLKGTENKFFVLSLVDEECKKNTLNSIPLARNANNTDRYCILGFFRQLDKNFKGCFEQGTKVQFVYFDSPRMWQMQFYSLRPINLSTPISLLLLQYSQENNYDAVELGYGCSNYTKFQEIYQKCHTSKYDNIQLVLDEVNIIDHHFNVLAEQFPGLSLQKRHQFFWKFSRRTRDMWHMCLTLLIVLIRIICEVWFQICDFFLLDTYSATGLQINLRCRQLCYFPLQYVNIWRKKAFKRQLTLSKSRYYSYLDYIKFYNTIWLIVNDVCFGFTLSSFLLINANTISTQVSKYLEYFFVDSVKSLTLFLSRSPFGIKLNDELSNFLKELFLGIIDFFNDLYLKKIVSPTLLSKVIKLVGLASYLCGATFALSICIDYLSLISLHLKLFYRISSKLYGWQLTLMRSLFYLFCGRKKNVLRNRVDNEEFTLDVMLMGILFFVILVFLLPTVFAFYITYSVLEYFTVITEIFFESAVMLLNHFPLFVLMLRCKDSKRIPGGIKFDICREDVLIFNNGITKKCVPGVKMETIPLNLAQIFGAFRQVMKDLSDQYFSLNTLKSIFLGQDITVRRKDLYATLYSSIPAKVIGIQDLRDLMEQSFNDSDRIINKKPQ